MNNSETQTGAIDLRKKTELPSFHYTFQITKSIMFNVSYYRLGNNKNKYFATSADLFNKPKSDWSECGQAQSNLLSGLSMKFYKKWDNYHTLDLSKIEYDALLIDIEALKNAYNFLHTDTDNDFNFSDIRTFSKQKTK